MIERIIKAFKESQKDYELLQKSKHWQKELDRKKHLYEPDFLRNFRNNTLSDGLDDWFPPAKQKEIFCDLLAECGKEFVFANLAEKNVGNSPQVFNIGNKVVDSGQNFSIRWLFDLTNSVFSRTKVNYVCEIGGGYGSLAQKIRANIPCKYILIDLPETNVLSSYYLNEHFPELKFLLCDEIQGKSVEKAQIDQYDFVIVPPWYDIKGLKINLFINTRSMMEMYREVIAKYFDFIQNNIADNGFFFNINRYYKDTVGYPIKLSEYPYDGHWNAVSSKPSWKQQHIHQLLAQRTPGRGNIKAELVKIEQLYQENKKLGKDLKKIGASKKLLLFIIGLPFKLLRLVLPSHLYKKAKNEIISQL